MSLVQESLDLQPPTTTAPPNCKHSFWNPELIHDLSSLSAHLFYTSLWLEVAVRCECLWILVNGVKLIQRLSTHLRFSPSVFPEQFSFGKSLQLNLRLNFLKITCKVRTPFHCFVLFTRKIKLIFPSPLLWMVLFCNTINGEKVLSSKKKVIPPYQ